ncbi:MULTISPECIES: NAD(P)/FAD-dependent oxidoreductase [Shouchella]|uniref:Oxidoreductase n=2 Tax=Bacillaceae TaxID=186817 RepID=A0A060M4Z4_9BACI|nr:MULTISPECIES: FAD-dependent oxidoreductase [Shouchella]AIC95154.1 oxidoreductase [Shouchella lehensis G1]KQL57606.1 oxidoreductase [Alkalicoccobacillus plakortidis]RQW20972.1 FAD-binding oxidoreductase [Bacillus sp. C1-1]
MKRIVILGGGIVGSSTAFHLAKQGYDVILIDSRHPHRATNAAAGIVCPWLSKRRNQAWYQLVRRSAAYYPSFVKSLTALGGEETGFKRTGALWIHEKKENVLETIERATEKRQEAPEIGSLTYLEGEELQEHFPLLHSNYYGVLVEGAGRVDGQLLTNSIQQAAQTLGASILHDEASVKEHENGRIAVVTSAGEVDYDELIITNGAWVKPLFESTSMSIDIRDQKAQIVHMQIDADTSHWPVVIPPGNQYLLAFEDGKIIAGSTYENHTNFESSITVDAIHTILHEALSVAPGLKAATYIDTKVGFRPVAPHHMPLFGRLPNHKTVWIANGLGSTGLTAGPYIGFALAESLANREVPLSPSLYDVASIIKH